MTQRMDKYHSLKKTSCLHGKEKRKQNRKIILRNKTWKRVYKFNVPFLIQYLYRMKRSFVYRYVYFPVTISCFHLMKKSRSFICVRAFPSWHETNCRNVGIFVCLWNEYRCVYTCICMCVSASYDFCEEWLKEQRVLRCRK